MTPDQQSGHIGIQLKDICFGKRTGQLHFRQGNIQKYLYFQNGELVFARTNQPQELLGEVLFRLGKIGEDVYSRIDEYLEPKKSIGQILIENNLISREDLRDGLSYQMREIVLNLFPNFLGECKFLTKASVEDETFDVRIEVPKLIEEGIRRMKFDPRLEAFTKDSVPILKSREYFLHLTEDEKEIYQSLSEDRESAALLQAQGFDPPLFWRSLYLFFCLDLIDLRTASSEERTVPEAPSRTSSAPATPAAPSPPPPPAPEAAPADTVEQSRPAEGSQAVADVLEFAERLSALNYFQVLEIESSASPVELKKTYFQMARKYHPDRFDRNLPDDVRTRIDEVFDKITKAYHTLSDEDNREEYERNLRETSGDEGRNRDKQAEVKFRQGKTLYNQTRFDEAVVLLEEAVRMKDDKASYFLLLALSQSKVSRYRRAAVGSFKKAIALEPWASDAYLGLGLLYKQEGMPVMAVKQFKKILSMDPDHRAALKELNAIEPQSTKKGLKDLLSGDMSGLLGRFRKK